MNLCSGCCTQWAGRPAATKGCFKKWYRDLTLRNLHITGKLLEGERGEVFGWPFPSATMQVHSAKQKVCAAWGVSTATMPSLGAVCREGWRTQKQLLPLLRLKPLKQERKKSITHLSSPHPSPDHTKQDSTWQRHLPLAEGKGRWEARGRRKRGGSSQHGEKPTIGARLPFWFRKHWLFAEEVIKSGSMPA